MSEVDTKQKVDSLNRTLMKLLGERSAEAVNVIDELVRIGKRENDNSLLGYAYYRFAYFYYFTRQDLKKFHKNLQIAIKYLLRSDNKEYLGGAYNLLAYDAQDLGCYDIAYAYFKLAVHASKQVEGIALPGIIDANAGRLLLELGDTKHGRVMLREAVKIIRKFKDLHVYHYNMIITYADESLASFILRDEKGVQKAFDQIQKNYDLASKEEKELCDAYYVLSLIYLALLRDDEKELNKRLKELFKIWKGSTTTDLLGVTFELEMMFEAMMEKNLIKQAALLLKETKVLKEGDNFTNILRYYSLETRYYERVNDRKKLKTCLYEQHDILKKQKDNAARLRKYAIEFSDMAVNISKERSKAHEENRVLQIQANTDSLTNLPNRNAMNKQLTERFEKAAEAKEQFGIGIIDVDMFKQYNDTFGHQVGDECLRRIGTVLMSFAEKYNIFCARYGGDEFVVGYFGYSKNEIEDIAKQMYDEISSDKLPKAVGNLETVHISQGIYNNVPTIKHKLWDYLSEADKELYRIKKEKSLSR